MTVSASYQPIVYLCDGAQKAFPIDFRIFDPREVQAGIAGEIVNTPLVYGQDYSVSVFSAGTGGTVHTPSPLANGTRLVLWLETDIIQEMDLVQGGRLPAERLESGMDRLTLICQQLQEGLVRCVKLAEGAQGTPEELQIELFDARDTSVNSAGAALASQNAAAGSAASAASSDGQALVTLGNVQAAGTAAQGAIANDRSAAQTAIASDRQAAQTAIADLRDESLISIQSQESASLANLVVQEDISKAAVIAVGTAQTANAKAEADRSKTEADRAETEANKAAAIVNIGPATASTLGLVKIGSGINVTPQGEISADTYANASKLVNGIVRVGNNIDVDAAGVISLNPDTVSLAENNVTLPTQYWYQNTGITVSVNKPISLVTQTFVLTTGTAVVRDFTIAMPADGHINPLARYELQAHFKDMQIGTAYTITAAWYMGNATTGTLITNGSISYTPVDSHVFLGVPAIVNYLKRNTPYLNGTTFTLRVTLQRTNGSAHTVTMHSYPDKPTMWIRNPETITSTDVLDCDGNVIKSQSQKNRQYEASIGNLNTKTQDASITQKGVVQLSNATNGTSQIKSVTEKALSDAQFLSYKSWVSGEYTIGVGGMIYSATHNLNLTESERKSAIFGTFAVCKVESIYVLATWRVGSIKEIGPAVCSNGAADTYDPTSLESNIISIASGPSGIAGFVDGNTIPNFVDNFKLFFKILYKKESI